MSYYKIISNLGNRRYLIESLNDGKQREMKMKYATIVRVAESGCQIIDSVSPIGCRYASADLLFVKDVNNNTIYPIEQKLEPLTDIHNLRESDVIEAIFRDSRTAYYVVTKIYKECQELILQEVGVKETSKITYKLSDIALIKSLGPNYRLQDPGMPILVDVNGHYYEYCKIHKTFDQQSQLQPGQIINITNQEHFSVAALAKELGTTPQIVFSALRNILPDEDNNGNGFDTNILSKRQCTDLEEIVLNSGECYRLMQFLQRPDTQCKLIIRWKYYINQKNSHIPCPKYLDLENNPYKEVIPYQHLDMDKYAQIIDWFYNKADISNDIESYFTLFHTLYWADQIIFLKKVLLNHLSKLHTLSDITKLEQLTLHPQHVNINILIFIHTLLKLNRDKTPLSNFELYNIWKSHLPRRIKGKSGLSLADYVGTNLFCRCKGAIGFGVEDWWLPGINADSKPVLEIFPNGEMTIDADPSIYPNIMPTIESSKDNRGFVVYRDSDDLAKCHYRGTNLISCPVINAINNDKEYRDKLISKVSKSGNIESKDGSIDDDIVNQVITFNRCPLISVPSWRYQWAEKHRDKCTASQQPRISSLYLWYNRNAKGKNYLFCEGKSARDKNNQAALHKTAKIPFSWCNGNACFTDIYRVPNAEDITKHFNIYNVAMLLGLIDESSKIAFQYFHSRLNWLNNAVMHIYCDCCDMILEAADDRQQANSAHSITWYECRNSQCSQQHKSIYISHCWNDRCRAVIDSRETSACPNNKYICPTCGVCCGEKMFTLKKESGLDYSNARHFEEGKFYCRKCGKQMNKQGNLYYCTDHPDVVTKPPRFN